MLLAGSESPASWSSWSQCNNGRRVRNWQCDPAKKHLCNAPKATEEQLCGEPSLELPSPSENTGEPPVLPVKPSEFDDFARKFSIPTEPTTDGIILDFITVSSPLSPQFPLVNDDSQQSQPPSFSPDQSNLAVVDNSQASVINRQPPTPSFISITQPTVIDNDGSFNQNAPPSNLPWEPRPPVLIPPRQWPGHFISESSARQPNFPLPPDGAQQLHPSGSGIFPNNNDEFLLPNGYILSFRKPFRQSETDNSTNPTVDPNIE